MTRGRELFLLCVSACVWSACAFPDTSRLETRCEIPLDGMTCPLADLGGLLAEGAELDPQALGCELWVRAAMETGELPDERLLSSSLWRWESPSTTQPEQPRCPYGADAVSVEPAFAASYEEAVLVCPSRRFECPEVQTPSPRPQCRIEGDAPLELGQGFAVAGIEPLDGSVAVLWYAGNAFDLSPRVSFVSTTEEDDLTPVGDGPLVPCEMEPCSRDGEKEITLPATQFASAGDQLLIPDLCRAGYVHFISNDSCDVAEMTDSSSTAERVLGVAPAGRELESGEPRLVALWTNGAEVLSTVLSEPPSPDTATSVPPTRFWNPDSTDREVPAAACFHHRDHEDSECVLMWNTPFDDSSAARLTDKWYSEGQYGELDWQVICSGATLHDAGIAGGGFRPVVAFGGLSDAGDPRGLAVWRDQYFGIVGSDWSLEPADGGGLLGLEEAQTQLGLGAATSEGWTVSRPPLVALGEDQYLAAWWSTRGGISGDAAHLELRRIGLSAETGALVTTIPSLFETPPEPLSPQGTDRAPISAFRAPGNLDDDPGALLLIAWPIVAAEPWEPQELQVQIFHVMNGPRAVELVFSAEARLQLASDDHPAVGAVAGGRGFVVAAAAGGAVTVTLLDETGAEVDQYVHEPSSPESTTTPYDVTLWAGDASGDGRDTTLLVAYTALYETESSIVPSGGIAAVREGRATRLGALAFDLSEEILDLEARDEAFVESLAPATGPYQVHPGFAAGPLPVLTWTSVNVGSRATSTGGAPQDISSTNRLADLRVVSSGDVPALEMEYRDIPAARLADLQPRLINARDVRCPGLDSFDDDEACMLVSFSSIDPHDNLSMGDLVSLANHPIGGLAVGSLDTEGVWAIPGQAFFEDSIVLPSGMLSAGGGEEAATSDEPARTLAAYTTLDPLTVEPAGVEVIRYDWGHGELDAESLDASWLTGAGRPDATGWSVATLRVDGEIDRNLGGGPALWIRQENLDDEVMEEYAERDAGPFRDDDGPSASGAPTENVELMFSLVDSELRPSARAVMIDAWLGEPGLGETMLWPDMGSGEEDGRTPPAGFVRPHFSSAVAALGDGRYLAVWRRDTLEARDDSPEPAAQTTRPILARIVTCQ